MQSSFSSNYLQGIDEKVIVEIFLEGGNEFTAIVLDVGAGFDSHPVALLPTEVLQDLKLLCLSSYQFTLG